MGGRQGGLADVYKDVSKGFDIFASMKGRSLAA